MIIIHLNNIYSQIRYDRRDVKRLEKILNKHFQVEVPGAKYTWLYKSKQWNGRTNLWENSLNAEGGFSEIQIRTGLIPRFIGELKKAKLSWEPGIDGRNLPRIDELGLTSVSLRDYQFEAIRAAFRSELENFGWYPRGVIEIGPGGGKTQVAVAMYEMNPLLTFFLVNKKDLLIQAYERYQKYGHEPGFIGDSRFNPKNNLNIATLQTLKSIIDNPEDKRFQILDTLISNCQQIFLDEAHLLASTLEKGNEFVQIIDKFEAPFRWGLTATAFRRNKFDNLLLEGSTGSLLYQIPASELIKRGYLTKPKVIMRHVPGTLLTSFDWKRSNTNKAKASHWREIEERAIKFNEPRTNLIIDEILSGPYPCLVLVKTVEQANFIKKLYQLKTQEDLLFLSGKDSAKVRRQAIQDLRDGILKTIMATTIFDEGVDVPELRKIIMASGGKSNVKAIQRPGRVLRKADGKKEAIIVDFTDRHASLVKKHADERRRVYEEQGFEVIVEKG